MMNHLWLVVVVVALEVCGVKTAVWGNSPLCRKRFHTTKRTNDYVSKRIVGGSESQQGSWPWQIALLINSTQYCGGSIINENWIVTAGHCVLHPENNVNRPEIFSVALGEHRLGVKESFEQMRKVERIFLHRDYEIKFGNGDLLFLDNDIALLKLSTPAIFDKNVNPICLLSDDIVFDEGKECYITGWGKTKYNGTQPDALREAKVELVSHEVCNQKQSYGGGIHKSSLCAGFKEGGIDACSFDSGGPLSCEKRGRFYLTGIVSWGHECARPHKYGVYSNMMNLTPWVKSTIKNFELES